MIQRGRVLDGTQQVDLDGKFDFMRATNQTAVQPLPRIPPFRVRGSVRYEAGAFNIGAGLTGVAAQERVFGAETPTDGYGLLKLFSSYSWPSGRSVNTITARLDNATNALYRNHLSYVKDYVPEKGRSFRLVYSVRF